MWVLGLVDIPWWIMLILCIILYILYTSRDFDYFKKQGVPYTKPWPLIGTSIPLFSKGFHQYDLDLQKEFGSDSVVGDFALGKENFIVFNADFLSKILVKEFASFTNRFVFPTGSNIMESMVVALKDARWRHVRNGMTPAFSTGKLKKMNAEINRCAQSLVDNLTKAVETGENITAKDYTGAYTMDVIASSAFGIRVNSQEESNNAFVRNAKSAIDLDLTNIHFLIPVLFPNFAKLLIWFGFEFVLLGKEQIDFFAKVTKQAIAMRTDEEQKDRSDFLQLMIKAQRGETIEDEDMKNEAEESHDNDETVNGLTTDEIIGNAMLFFIAGYDTTATTLQFFLYNMARYPNIQEKIREEIETVMGEETNVEYTMLNDMPYLDQCLHESLRMYPPIMRFDRTANHDMTINDVFIKKGMVINIPVYAIHHDPERWPEPEEYIPERFSAENRKKQNQFSFMPFGSGPRTCIGMRLALLEMKVAIIYLLRAFKVTTCDKTPAHPLTYKIKGFLTPSEDIVVKLEQHNG